MKILFYRYGSICEPDIIDQFKAIGFEIETENAEITNKKMQGNERIELMNKHLEKGGFLFVFSINFFPGISDICNIYGVPYVCWTVDNPVLELYSTSIKNPVNHIFVFDKAQYDILSQYINGVYYLPLATNVSRWDKVLETISSEDKAKYSADISFVGSLYLENNIFKKADFSDYMKGFAEGIYAAQREIEGYNLIERSLNKAVIEEMKNKLPDYYTGFGETIKNVDNYVTAQPILGMHYSSLARVRYLTALGEHFDVKLFTRSSADEFKETPGIKVCEGVNTLTEMPKVFNLSKINLNFTIYPIEKGIPLRVWDVMGSGGFLLTNYREEMLEYFEPGVDFDYFSDINELVYKCEYYLSHEEERKQIARNGYEKVKLYHTYTNRTATILKTILE